TTLRANGKRVRHDREASHAPRIVIAIAVPRLINSNSHLPALPDDKLYRLEAAQNIKTSPEISHAHLLPAHPRDGGRESALSYAKQRAGYGCAEIQVFDEADKVVETIGNEDAQPLV